MTFLCIFNVVPPVRYMAGICYVTFIEMQYVQHVFTGTCFLIWLYIDKSCPMPQHSALQSLFSYSPVDMHMPLLKTVLTVC